MPIQRVVAISENPGDSDWFRVRLVAGQTYQVRLTSSNQAAFMTFMLPDGQQMRFPIPFANYANFVAPVSGDHFISATSLGGSGASLYHIDVETLDDPIPASTATMRSLAVDGTEAVTGNNNSASTNDDWFAIDLVAGQSYLLATDGGGDVYIVDGDGSLVAIEGLNGRGGPQVHFTATETGRFYAGAQHSGATEYELTLLAVDDDYGDTPAMAGAIGVGVPVGGRWETAGDDDAYEIVLNAGSSYAFSVQNLDDPAILGFIRILDESGTLVWTSAGQSQTYATIFSPAASAIYYVSAGIGAVTSPGDPQAHLTGWDYALTAAIVTGDLPDNVLTAGALQVGSAGSSGWEYFGDRDWVKVNLVEGQSYLFELTAPSSDGVRLALYDGDGTQVSDFGGTSLHHSAAATGSYFIAALAGAGTGSYTISAAAVADDYANNGSTAGVVVNGAAGGVAEVDGDADWFAVELTAGLTYKLTPGSGATTLTVRDTDGVALTVTGLDLSFTPSVSGIYFVEAEGLAGAYTFTIGAVADDYGESLATTGVIRTEIIGTGGPDILAGSDAYELFAGAAGDDFFVAGTGYDRFEGGSGVDTLSYADSPLALDVDLALGRSLIDGAQDDAILQVENVIGSAFDDIIAGSSAANILDGGAGDDQLAGGLGNDTYYVDSAGDVVTETAGQGTDRIATAVGYTLAAGSEVEQLEAVNSAATGAMDLTGNAVANTITGNAGVNILRGEAGSDILGGLAGNDFLVGGTGADFMYGGTGDDTYYIDNAGDQASEQSGEGTDRIATTISYALLASSEIELLEVNDTTDTNAIDLTGSNFANLIIGSAGVNILRGEGGNDTLVGLVGNDFLVGGTGADLMYGGTGNDTYYVDDLGDQANEAAGEGTDRIATSISFALQASSEVELLETVNTTDTSAMDLTGSNFANQIIGSDGVNILRGEGGNDTLTALGGDDFLVGGAGNDAMFGNSGNDTYYVDAAGDTVTELAGQGTDRIATSVSYTLAAGSEVETLEAVNGAATDAMNLTGNATGNAITGNDGANILDGKGGSDVLLGLGGADTFAFTTALGVGNVDVIVGFVSGADKIALDDAVFTGLAPGALPVGAFVIGSQAGDADDRIVYNAATGALLFDADGSGAGAAVQFATLDGHPALGTGDFIVI